MSTDKFYTHKSDAVEHEGERENVNYVFDEDAEEIDWEQLEKRYRIVIEGNKATVSKRGWFEKTLFTATAFLGTKAVDVLVSQGGCETALELDNQEIFTESNLEAELKVICLFVAADYEAANRYVAAHPQG